MMANNLYVICVFVVYMNLTLFSGMNLFVI